MVVSFSQPETGLILALSLHILITNICQLLFYTVSCVIFPILIPMSVAQDLTSHLILSYSLSPFPLPPRTILEKSSK